MEEKAENCEHEMKKNLDGICSILKETAYLPLNAASTSFRWKLQTAEPIKPLVLVVNAA